MNQDHCGQGVQKSEIVCLWNVNRCWLFSVWYKLCYIKEDCGKEAEEYSSRGEHVCLVRKVRQPSLGNVCSPSEERDSGGGFNSTPVYIQKISHRKIGVQRQPGRVKIKYIGKLGKRKAT